MKRTFVKKVLAELLKAMDENGFKGCEIMENPSQVSCCCPRWRP